MHLDSSDSANNVTVRHAKNHSRFSSLLAATLLMALQGAHAAIPTVSIVIVDPMLGVGETTQVTFTFSEAVNGFDHTDLTVTGGSLGPRTTSDNTTWTATLTPPLNFASSGNTISVALSGVTSVSTDEPGVGTATSAPYTIDTIRPTADIVVSDTLLTADETSLVTITFNEAVTGLTLADFIPRNGTLSSLSTADNIVYNATLTPTANLTRSTNVITLDNTGVMDGAGNAGAGTTDSNNYAIDTERPRATLTLSDTELNWGETATVTIVFNEPVTGLDLADLSADSGTISALTTADNVTYTAQFTPTANLPHVPTNRIRLDNTGVQDSAGNAGTGFTDSSNYTVRTVRLTFLVTSSIDTGDDSTIAADVTIDGADGDGLSLREAIGWARSGDTIIFDLNGGVSGRQGGTITLGGTQLSLNYNITIDGDVDGDHVPDVTISGNGASRIFLVDNNVTLEGLTLIDGSTFGGGAAVGVGVAGVAITLRDCVLDNNHETGSGGGAIYASGSAVTLINTTVSNNSSANFGGGVRVVGPGGSLNVINSTITGNRTAGSGSHGGGIQFGGSGTMTIVNSTISGNAAMGSGSLGGGVRVTPGSGDVAYIYNSTIVGNAAESGGGGVHAGRTETIANTVVAGNVSGAGSQPAVGGSSLATGGSPDDVADVLDVAMHSYFGSNVTITADTGSLNSQGTGNLLLGDLAFNNGGHVQTHKPQIGSALIGAGNAAQLPADAYDLDEDGDTSESLPIDANGNARVRAGLDIGAVEFASAAVTSVSSTVANGSYGVGASIPITVTFDAPVVVTTSGGVPTLTLETGAIDRPIAYVAGSTTDTLTFNYVVQPGDVSADLDYHSAGALTLNGAIIRDLAGVDATLTLPIPGSALSLAGQKAIVIGGVAVNDQDGDGMSDEFEQRYGLDPHDPSDAATDLDGDGVSNLDEFLQGSDPTRDDQAPLISSPPPVTIDATGLLTIAPTLTPPSAVDGRDGPVTASLVEALDYLAPGTHTVTWQATDAAGNRGQTLQAINVRPLISLGPDQVSGEGADVSVRFFLNGTSPSYPLTVAYTVGGTAGTGDHDLVSGVVVFEQDEVEKTVTVYVTDDGIAEGEETLTVALTGEGNFGARRNHVIRIVETNVAPTFDWSVVQGGRQTSVVVREGGLVTLGATVRDSNPADEHTYHWSIPADILATSVGSSVRTFDPSLLAPGFYKFELAVGDSGTPAMSTYDFRVIEVVADAPALSASMDTDGDGIDDASEGWGDDDGDGQPNYLDASDLRNVLNERVGDDGLFLIEADPGVRLILGEGAFQEGADGALLNDTERAGQRRLPLDIVRNAGGYFDFGVRDLPSVGGSIQIVIPQRQPIPVNAVYRQFAAGHWTTFIENSRNRVASAPGLLGVCPPPGSLDYRAGLSEGDWCVQVTIEDGGANDADGMENFAISNLGGVGSVNAFSRTTRGGGGSMGPGFLLLLLTVMVCRGRRSQITVR
ncbi:Ig-like domain-containing protein [Steroidobacter cummioxidans]|uniref:Ig-like domain-containing protein n=1 Tax=Steroidobacter cummioxidans TaxID=1803913 RepID=UPI000E317B74|nr:Ig-like domain-containing protein [Steroidobacter cummioxidans]